jgi:hypothetical protein
MRRRIARWIFWNVPLPRSWAPHVLAMALGTKRYSKVDIRGGNGGEVPKIPAGRSGE